MRVFPIIKCAGIACNLRCEYCYYRYLDQAVRPESTMSDEVLEQLIGQLLEINPGTCEFLWHGGEPLIAGMGFFEKVLRLQTQYNRVGTCIVNSVQTNGVLLDQKWARFLKDNKFKVGVSLDGPAHIHDHHRKAVGGRGSFDAVMRSIQACREEGVAPGIIAVVTAYSVQFPEELYRFFVDHGLKKFSLNPVFETDREGGFCTFSVGDKEFADFSEAILRLWLQDDDPAIDIRQFVEPLMGMLGGTISACIYSGECSKLLDFFPNGEVRPCHSVHGRSEVLGNILRHHLTDILSRERYLRFARFTKKLPHDCLQCRWLPICHGGCTDHRNVVVNGQTREQYFYCGSRKRVFEILEGCIGSAPIAESR